MLKQFVVITISVFYLVNTMASDLNSGNRTFGTSVIGVDVTQSATNEFPRVIFLDGMTFGGKQSWQAVKSLADLLEMPVGRFNIKFDPTPGITLSDAVTEKTLTTINKMWGDANTKGLIILFMAGNNQFLKALEVGKLHNSKMNSISVIAVANETPMEQRVAWFNESQERGDHPFQKFVTNEGLKRILMDWKKSNK